MVPFSYRILKYSLLLFVSLILTACYAGPNVRQLGAPITHKNPQVTTKPLYSYTGKLRLSTKGHTVIENKIPLYVLSGDFTPTDYQYAKQVCKVLNDDIIASQNYVCLPQSVGYHINVLKHYLIADDMHLNKHAINAQFLIVPANLLYQKEHLHQGPLVSLPSLDVAMYLNGSYLFLWGDYSYGAAELSNFARNFTYMAQNVDYVTIGVTSPEARELVNKLILSNQWSTHFKIVDFDPTSDQPPEHFDLIASYGPHIPAPLKEYIKKDGAYIPLNISEPLLKNVQRQNPYLSTQDVTKFFSLDDMQQLFNVLHLIVNASGKEHKHASNKDDLDDYLGFDDESDEKSAPKVKLPAFVQATKFPKNYKEQVFGPGLNLKLNIQPIEKILANEPRPYVKGVKLSSIGIRNVLVATRAAVPNQVYVLVTAFLNQLALSGEDFLTPDMNLATQNSVLTGNLANTSLFTYHYALSHYLYYATLENNGRKVTERQAEIANDLKEILNSSNTISTYGPPLPTAEQQDKIHSIVFSDNLRRQQEKTLEGLNSIVTQIEQELNVNKKEALIKQLKTDFSADILKSPKVNKTSK